MRTNRGGFWLLVFGGMGLFGLATVDAQGDEANVVHLVSSTASGTPYLFSPMELTVPIGTKIKWINDEEVTHTITSTASQTQRKPSGLFDKSLTTQNETFEFTIGSAGRYEYYCKPHQTFMYGTIIVEGPNAPTTTPAAQSPMVGVAGVGLALLAGAVVVSRRAK